MIGDRTRRTLLLVCVMAAVAHAVSVRWTCDDAFISFRYAANLAAGRGLVFNVGERVEGYTNFLWTVWLVPALKLGIAPESWTQVWGGAAYGGTVALLGIVHERLARRSALAPMVVPFACIAAAAHREWAIFSMSGLETSAFTFFAVAAFAVLLELPEARRPIRWAAAVGVLVGLATLVRPDGVVFGGAIAFWLGWRALPARGGAVRDVIAFVATFGCITGAHLLFRVAYYGDVFPNTYYAKSGDHAWWGQGCEYLWLYVLRYPPIALAPLALALTIARARVSLACRARVAPAGLAMLLGGAHALWAVRVGGDFMFGRFLVPSTPFFLFVFEGGLWAMLDGAPTRRRIAVVASAVVAVAAIAWLPSPLPAGRFVSGIADEYAYNSPERSRRVDDEAALVKPVLEGLGARVAFYGSQARFVYRAEIPIAVESVAGLTDAFIAHQPLERRGRIGHEKHAPPSYLVDVRRLHLAYPNSTSTRASLEAYIPTVSVDFGGVRMRLLRWDVDFVRALRARGAVVADFPSMLDALAPTLDGAPPSVVKAEYERARRIYFAWVDDPARERIFLDRLEPP